MRHTAFIAAMLAALLALAVPAWAGMEEDCVQEYDWDLKIGGCTAVIGSGQYSGRNLAVAYFNRGNAYANLGEYRRAIEDYDQALRLDPDFDTVYTHRSKARATLSNLIRSGEGSNEKAAGGDTAEITSTGTGFFVDATGSLLTNAHVVENCSALTVGDGLPAELLALDGNADLALLRARMSPTNNAARFAARPARLNADVTVVGFPLHGVLGGLNVTRGAVSSTSGLMGDDNYFQMSAAVQLGNSGGPVVNEFGAVVGVVQSKLDALTVAVVTGDIPQNINFAIRAELAKLFLNKHSVDFEIEANQVRVEPWALADDAKRYTVLISCWNG